MKLFYRQKLLLGILQAFGGKLSRIDMQKYLFLYTQTCQNEKSYEFVPYKLGSFSFQSYADFRRLKDMGILAKVKGWHLVENRDFISMLNTNDREKVSIFFDKYKGIKGKKLIQKVYKEYPYYAIRSVVASKWMTENEMERIKEYDPSKSECALFTIGYEGSTLENYLNRLIKNDVKILVDVRKNPISRKYGFSKKTLSNALTKLGIEYKHFPEFGIESDKRKNLKTEHDYQILFDEYEKTVLQKNESALKDLLNLLIQIKRVAITCFELESHMCHRGRVAKAMESLPSWKYRVQHI